MSKTSVLQMSCYLRIHLNLLKKVNILVGGRIMWEKYRVLGYLFHVNLPLISTNT